GEGGVEGPGAGGGGILPRVRGEGGASRAEDQPVGGDLDQPATGAVYDFVPAARSDVPAGGCGECVGVVHVDVSDRKARGIGVDEMRKTSWVRGHELVVLAVMGTAFVRPAVLRGQTSLSIYSDGRVGVRRTLPEALEKWPNAV